MTSILVKVALALMLAGAAAAATAAGPVENTSYGYAQVLRVEPVYEVRTVQTVDPECLRPDRARAAGGSAIGGCVPRPVTVRRIVAYDVEYSYKGETYMSRLSRDPGSRLRIRVSVTPDDPGATPRVAPEQDR